MEKNELNILFENFNTKNIIIIGDLMLDRYLCGTVQRISPEAPVPVVEIESEFARLGGAANVANNIASLGANPIALGVVGDDASGQEIRAIFEEQGFSTSGIVTDPARCTTEKTRLIAHNQHVVRTDRETKTEIDDKILKKIIDAFKAHLPEADAIILQDYNKGLITKKLIREIIALCRKHDKLVMVDPKFQHFFDYKDVALIKPNKKEAEQILGTHLTTEAEIIAAGKEIKKRLNCAHVLITLSAQGMCLFNGGDQALFIPTTARKVHDVSGAGDTVISVLSVVMSSGASISEAAKLANYAAGLVCEEVGVVPINKEKFLNLLMNMKNEI